MTTAPTPAITPSVIKSRRSPGGIHVFTSAERCVKALSIQSIGYAATENIVKNIKAMSPKKINQPQNLCVKMLSKRSLTLTGGGPILTTASLKIF